MPNLFREYVTEQAFVISLRKTHIWVLAHVAEGDHAKRDQKDIAAAPGVDHFVPAVRSLIAKGLVTHNSNWDKNKKPAYALTDAGKHVVELLKLAELIYPNRKKEAA